MISRKYEVLTPIKQSNSQHMLWVLSAILIGAFFRLFKLDSQSLWFDEAARLAMASSSLTSILNNEGQDTLPPFFHLCQHFWLAIVGLNDYAARFLPAIAGILLLPIIYRLGIDLWGRKTGLISLTIAAFMPYLVYQSQQANLYSLLAMFSGIQILAFWRAAHTNRGLHWLFFAVWTILGLYTHYFVIFTTFTLHIFWLFHKSTYRKQWQRLLLIDGVIALAFLPQLNRLLQGTNVVFTNFWLTKPNFLAPFSTLYLFTVSYSLPRWTVPIAMFVIIAIFAIGLYELVSGLKRRHLAPKPLLFTSLLATLPIFLVFAISQFKPIFLERTLIGVVPAYIVLLGYSFVSSPRYSPLRYLFLLLGCLMIFSLGQYYFNPIFAKPAIKDAAEYISRHYQQDDVVIHTGNGSYVPFLFYNMPQEHYLLSGDPSPHNPAKVFQLAGGKEISTEAIKKYRRIWVVAMLDHSIEYQETALDYFEQTYTLQTKQVIDGIIIRNYDLK